MTLEYQDFSPSAVEHKVLSTEYENFSEVVAHANEWIRDSSVTVLNVETVLLPNLQNLKDTLQVIQSVSGPVMNSSYLFQVLRVWYDSDNSKNHKQSSEDHSICRNLNTIYKNTTPPDFWEARWI